MRMATETSCYYCESAVWRSVWHEGYMTPVCCKHARRIQRRGTHKPFEAVRKVTPDAARRLHGRGLSLSQIADAFGCGKTTVWDALNAPDSR